jgi:hypothetical protein
MTIFPTVEQHLIGKHITEIDQYPDAEKYGLSEGTPAGQTLKDKTKKQPDTTAQAELLAKFMRLPVERQKSLLGLDDTDRDNDDWGKNYAARNRASHKAGGGTTSAGDLKMKKLRDTIKEAFPGTSDELLDRFQTTFLEYVERWAASDKINEIIAEVFENEPIFNLVFASDETIDAVELLSARINELEEAIVEVEAENEELLDQQLQLHSEMMGEEALYDAAPPRVPTARPRRSLDPDFTFNENGEFLIDDNGGRSQHQRLDPKMARYVQKLNEVTRNADVHPANENLLEAWKNN